MNPPSRQGSQDHRCNQVGVQCRRSRCWCKRHRYPLGKEGAVCPWRVHRQDWLRQEAGYWHR
ncbi:MAG: hypothetical protein ACK56I_37490, partial [bacterium]